MNSKENSTRTSRVATMDDIQADAGHLSLLLDTAVSVLMEMDFGVGPKRNHQLDRVNALVAIGRDMGEKLASDCGTIRIPKSAVVSPVEKTSRSVPGLDLAGWSITDLEQAYTGLVRMADAGNHILCQPRSTGSDVTMYIPGARFIEKVITDWIDWQVTAIIEHAKSIRFPVPADDERRVALLLRFNLDYPGAALTDLIQMALTNWAGVAK